MRLEEAIRKEQAKTPRRDDKIARLNEALKNVVPGALRKAAKRLAFQTPSKYSVFEISYFAGYGGLVMREKVWKMARSRPDIAYGVTILSRIRCGRYWTASRRARLGLIDIQWNGKCPMCLEEYQEDVVHMMLTCKKWQRERDKTWHRVEEAYSATLEAVTTNGRLILSMILALPPLRRCFWTKASR